MINWYNLFANSLWILALALALATLSHARWQARRNSERLKDQLDHPRWGIPLNLSGVLFCLGLALTSDTWWEITLWGLLGISFIVQFWLLKPK